LVEKKLTDIYCILSGGGEGEYKIRGWLHHKRSSGGVLFLIIRDGTGIIQCVAKRDKLGDELFEKLEKLPVESVLEVSGFVRKDFRAPFGCELSIEEAKIIGESESGYPIARKYHGPDFLLDNRHLWIRNEKMQAILRVRSKLLKAAREWLEEHDFTEAHAPIFTAAACEGGATLFPVDYFGKKVYLTQSWQLYAEAMIASLGKIYTIAPSFRAEKSRTRRHLTEYWHLEVEIPFCNLNCIIKVAEELVSYICKRLAERARVELKFLGRNPEYLKGIDPPFKKLTYDEVVDMLQSEGVQIEWGEDLDWSHEKVIASKFNEPFFITHFPKGAKAFYHKPDPKRPEVTLSADMLAPEGYGEIIGGGERIDDVKQLLKSIKDDGLNPKDYKWYIDLRRYGSVPHSGFGLGVERMLMWVCKLKHIRDAIAFPRLVRRSVYP